MSEEREYKDNPLEAGAFWEKIGKKSGNVFWSGQLDMQKLLAHYNPDDGPKIHLTMFVNKNKQHAGHPEFRVLINLPEYGGPKAQIVEGSNQRPRKQVDLVPQTIAEYPDPADDIPF